MTAARAAPPNERHRPALSPSRDRARAGDDHNSTSLQRPAPTRYDDESEQDRRELVFGAPHGPHVEPLSSQRAAAELERFRVRVALRERRHLLLAAASSQLARARVGVNDRRAFMRVLNATRCVPPLEDRDIVWIDNDHGGQISWSDREVHDGR